MLPLSVAILLISSSVVLLRRDLDQLPKMPRPNEGRTWRLEEHGAIAYGTLSETATVYGLLISGFVVGAFGVCNERWIRSRSGLKDA